MMEFKRLESSLLNEAFDFLSDLKLRMSVEDFMKKLLEAALVLLPDFDRGSVIMEDKDGNYRYVAWVGFGNDLAKVRYPIGKAMIPEGDNPIVIDRIHEWNKRTLKEEDVKSLKDSGADEIKKTIAIGIRIEGRIAGGFFLDTTRDVEPTDEDLKIVKVFARIASIFATMKLYQERERGYQREIIMAMIKAMEARDPYTVGHSERVAKYAVSIAKKMGLSTEDVDRIFWGSIVHDIGKLSIPEYILLKPTRLSEAEFEVIKRHPVAGENMIKGYPWLDDIRPIVRNHHERWDGKGYPDGLKGNEIPLEVRIVSVADSFDAMTSDRAYRKGMPLPKALKEIERQAGSQFDPEVVKEALEVLPKVYRDIYIVQSSS